MLWLTVVLSAFTVAFHHLPQPTQRKIVKIERQVHKSAINFVRQVAKRSKPAKSSLTSAAYMEIYESELARLGSPDEVRFLTSMVSEESRGNHMAVSFLPADLEKGRKKPLWHCGPVQHQCKSRSECSRFQQDPKYAAREDLKLLRYFDRWRGTGDCSRRCNWQYGPGHKKCRMIRAANKPTS